jgi:hypothetical protein
VPISLEWDEFLSRLDTRLSDLFDEADDDGAHKPFLKDGERDAVGDMFKGKLDKLGERLVKALAWSPASHLDVPQRQFILDMCVETVRHQLVPALNESITTRAEAIAKAMDLAHRGSSGKMYSEGLANMAVSEGTIGG